MNIMIAGMLGGWDVFVIVGSILILFGAKRIPEFAKGLGQGIREFKKAANEVTDEVHKAGDNNPQQKPSPNSDQTQSQPTVAQSSTTPKA